MGQEIRSAAEARPSGRRPVRPPARSAALQGGARVSGKQVEEVQIAICRPGGDLLSHTLRCSTIGAGEFHGRVRDGIGWGLPARATRPAKRNLRELVYIFF